LKTTAEIRQAFLDFFAARQYEVVTSSSLVPADDPTLLFTNAGMSVTDSSSSRTEYSLAIVCALIMTSKSLPDDFRPPPNNNLISAGYVENHPKVGINR
jgi:tRNA synthetases class II (A)